MAVPSRLCGVCETEARLGDTSVLCLLPCGYCLGLLQQIKVLLDIAFGNGLIDNPIHVTTG